MPARSGGSTIEVVTTRRGRAVAIAAATLGLATLAASGLLFKDRLAEEWWLWRLRSPDRAERERAAARLGELKSARAVPRLVELLVAESVPEAEMSNQDQVFILAGQDRVQDGSIGWSYVLFPLHYATRALMRIGPFADPQVLPLLTHEKKHLRFHACTILGERCPGAVEAKIKGAEHWPKEHAPWHTWVYVPRSQEQ
ncbi:MAG: hypothetical protein HY717_22805 [Planctomycetes bacterium]|nr:hypothetical protein [Planctomycetota bacterium]